MEEESCAPYDLICLGEQGISNAVGGAIEDLANAVLEAVGTMVTSLGTMWVYIGTPNLTTTGGRESLIPAGASDPNSGELTTLLGYVMGIGLALAVISVIWLAGLIAASMRRGEGALNVGRIGVVLAGVVVMGSASAIVAGVLPSAPRNAAGATLFIQSSLWWYTAAVAVGAVVVGGARMVWHARAEEGRNILQGLLTLIVVAAFGVTATQAGIAVADSFSVWILRGAIQCDVTADANCFGENVLLLLPLAKTGPAAVDLGSIVIIILGIIAFLAAVLQVVLMVARAGMLVILAGILPLSAAGTNTEVGKAWFRRCVGWLVAFLLYKPAAAIVYATAFQLVGTSDVFGSGDAVIAVLTGLMLMVLALFALPALMGFVTPLVGMVSGGAGGAAVVGGAMAAAPMGAVQAGRLMGGRSSADSATGAVSSGGSSSSGASSSSGPSGSDGSTGSQGSGGPAGGTPAAGASGAGTTGAAGGQGAAAGGAAGGAGAASGAASGAAAGGAAAGGATAAGAAAGPVGAAAGAAVDLASRAGQAATAAARAVAQDTTGEKNEGGPSGSR